jgi:hypothetical protein
MSRFAITSVFEVLTEPPPPPDSLRPVERSGIGDPLEASVEFCAFTADLVHVLEDERPREASRRRHPAFVSWIRHEARLDGSDLNGLGDDHRAA